MALIMEAQGTGVLVEPAYRRAHLSAATGLLPSVHLVGDVLAPLGFTLTDG